TDKSSADPGPRGLIRSPVGIDRLIAELQKAEVLLARQDCIDVDAGGSLFPRVKSVYVVAGLSQARHSARSQQDITGLSDQERLLGSVFRRLADSVKMSHPGFSRKADGKHISRVVIVGRQNGPRIQAPQYYRERQRYSDRAKVDRRIETGEAPSLSLG